MVLCFSHPETQKCQAVFSECLDPEHRHISAKAAHFKTEDIDRYNLDKIS